MTKVEFQEWKQQQTTQEFFKFLGEYKNNLAQKSTLMETADQTLKATAFKEGQMYLLNDLMDVDFSE